MKKFGSIALIAGLFLSIGCKKQVRRLDTDITKDLSGRFNDTDSRMIAEDIIKQMINECYDLHTPHEAMRVVAVGEVKNLSHEHIDSLTFMNDIERSLINSRICRIVANKSIRDAISSEMYDYDPVTYKSKLEENAKKLGVNRMIFGSITSIIDKEKDRMVRFYQFDIKLIDIETQEVMWIGTKKIKKYIKG